jgi:hypothetical protein
MKEAKLSITATLKNEGQSYWTVESKPTIFILRCKSIQGQALGETLNCEFWV